MRDARDSADGVDLFARRLVNRRAVLSRQEDYPRAIDVHIRHLREKLEPEPDKPRYILTVRGAGYRLRGP